MTRDGARPRWPVVAGWAAAGGAVLAVVLSRGAAVRPAGSPSPAPPAAPQYVGTAACVDCHAAAGAAWRGSQHAHAMQPATPDTVLGDFADATFTKDGVTSTFSRVGDRFVVRTDGPDGTLADYDVRWTFGLYPLQQYLVGFPGGRMQALPLAWDARPRAAGGGRWFHLYPEERIDHRDPLHWTRGQQNWNYMCADCHATNLRRHYDPVGDRYATTWAEPNVACESCHGPGSRHVAWAKEGRTTARPGDDGLAIALDERRDVTWTPNAAGNATRSRPLASHREVETCAPCHARRTPIGDDPGPTGRLLDTHLPALLDEGLYHADGQQLDEVYIYGSFLQSRMYAKGVTCSDCHDPHTQKLRAPGSAVCAQCHAPAKYAVPSHGLHPTGSAGADCVACHMPTRTYMVVDPRHDHSIRIPRPDLTVRYGVPNACAACHADRDAAWAAAAIERVHGPDRKGFQTFVDALDAGRRGAPGARERLVALVDDAASPAIARATAAAQLGRFPGAATAAAVRRALADPDPLLRTGALDGLDDVPPAERAALVAPLLDDPVKAVRVRVGRALAGVPLDGLAPDRRATYERLLAEYVASEEAIAERPEAHLNLGRFWAERGDPARAEAEYRTAIAREVDFVPAYANLADLYRALGRDDDAAGVLADGLRAVPDDPSLLYALGLLRVRQGRAGEALPLFARATAARPDHPRFAYVYGVALHSAGRGEEATKVLADALGRAPYDRDLLLGLATFERDAGHVDAARGYARRLVEVMPDDPGARRLLDALATR